MFKNPQKNFCIIVGLFIIYQLNYSYFGIGFWWETLDQILSYFPIILISLICINSIYSYKKRLNLLFNVQIVSFILVGLFFIFSWVTKAEFIQRFYLSENRKAEIFLDNKEDHYFIIEETKPIFGLQKSQCIYVLHVGPYDDVTQSGSSLFLRDKEIGKVDKDISNNVYECKDETGEIKNFDPLKNFLLFWWKLFTINSRIEKTIEEYEV